MTHKRKAIIASVAGIYVALWIVTYLSGIPLLERQLKAEVMEQWRESRPAQKERSERFPESAETIAFEKGPSAEAELKLCLAPFVFIAECSRVIGGLNGRGSYGVYFFTPWRVYTVSEVETWIS